VVIKIFCISFFCDKSKIAGKKLSFIIPDLFHPSQNVKSGIDFVPKKCFVWNFMTWKKVTKFNFSLQLTNQKEVSFLCFFSLNKPSDQLQLSKSHSFSWLNIFSRISRHLWFQVFTNWEIHCGKTVVDHMQLVTHCGKFYFLSGKISWFIAFWGAKVSTFFFWSQNICQTFRKNDFFWSCTKRKRKFIFALSLNHGKWWNFPSFVYVSSWMLNLI